MDEERGKLAEGLNLQTGGGSRDRAAEMNLGIV
jgi:hypothetical protein